MFGNIVPLTTAGVSQVLPSTVLQTTGNVLPTNNVGNSDLVIIQDTTTATSQAELINQLQNHITENQQILIITDDQGQDQYVIIDKDQDINALLQDGSLFSHYAEQQVSQIPAGLQQQILQISSMPTIQTTHTQPVASTPVPIQPKPTPKPIAPATMNPSIVQHKQSFQSKVNTNAFHVQNVEESVQRVTAPPPKRKQIEIRYDPKENSFQNAFLKFLAGEKMPSLEALANEPIMRKPKDNVYIGAVNAGIVLSSLGQPTGTMGYQTYMVNDESRIEEIMVIGRPLYDDSKGVKINPLLKNLPTTANNQTGAFLPQTITLTPNSQQQDLNTLTGLFRNAQSIPNMLNNATTITLPQHIIDQLSAGTLTVSQTTNGNEGIESATASAAAILSQLNEMVQGQQQQQQQQQQTNQTSTNYLSNDLLATNDPNRIQSEKQTADALLAAAISKRNFGTNSTNVNSINEGVYQSTTTNASSYMDIDRPSLAAAALYDLKNEQLQLASAALQQQVVTERNQQDSSNNAKQQETTNNQAVTTNTGTQQYSEEVGEMGPEIPFEIGQFLLYKGHFLNLLHFPVWKVHTKTLLLKYDTVLADSEIAWEATDEGMFYTNVYEDYVPLKCELKGLHNNQEVVRIVNESHPIKLKIHGYMSSVRIQHDVYAQVLVNHVYDADVLPRIKANTDEYATYIRLIDEILEQRYNYVIQSRRTIETFPYAVTKYPLLDIIAQPQRQLHCQVTEDKSQSVSHTLRFHGNQYDVDTLKASETPLQILEIFVCENIAVLAQTAHQLKHHIYHMFCHAQQKVVELQALNPTAEATELISAICGDTAWLQELFDRFESIMQQADTYIFSNVEIAW
ncbi:unnamed protein product [Rotaria socialis]|uniref:DUF4211 domain-containing protein n=1 Tax=Rotaria socialis TaxID=392032 RepID=A0A820TUI3_9BILA|nr:unnamed protein product [Rotaria socialis]CAF4476282.1 unnamed protein product [Rotaria socialis]